MDFYDIMIDGKVAHQRLTRDEFFSIMEELAMSYYQTGVPHPNYVSHITYKEESD